ncbi:hypothetical protein [Variovorax sp. OAS795]|uniref:hypothetical protein n=1 Tax=Variovorax sp. OAS795 TaxID=3034231 RepID=UPI0033991192
MIHAAEDAGDLPEGVATNLTRSFPRGGIDTTISGIGAALHGLAKHPAQWHWLREDPARAQGLRRGDPPRIPVQVMFRTTCEAVTLGGCRWRPTQTWPPSSGRPVGTRTNCVTLTASTFSAHRLVASWPLARAHTLRFDGMPKWRPINTLRILDRLPLAVEAGLARA